MTIIDFFLAAAICIVAAISCWVWVDLGQHAARMNELEWRISRIDDYGIQQAADIKKHRNMIVADREEIKDVDRRLNIQLAMVHEHQKQIERLFTREYVIVEAERWLNTAAENREPR